MKKFINFGLKLTTGFVAAMLLTACPQPVEDVAFGVSDLSITAYLAAPEQGGRFDKFLKIMEVGGVNNTLTAFNKKGLGYTLFAPNNDAVEAFIQRSKAYSSFDQLIADVDFVKAVSRYHILMSDFQQKDFGYGVMADTTATGDFLTLTYRELYAEGLDSVMTLVNGYAPISLFDVEAANGSIHEIDIMLEPNIYNAYQWIINQQGFDIFTQALEATGLSDTINSLYRLDGNGKSIKNTFTLLLEPDSIFHKRGIMNYDDLYDKYYTDGSAPTDKNNGLYQFVAYHISEKPFFLNDPDLTTTINVGTNNNPEYVLVGSTMNTYSILPFSIVADFDGVKVNRGIAAIDSIIQGGDTIPLNWIPVIIDQSNLATRNGPIHFISEILEMKTTAVSNKYIGPGGFDPVFQTLWNKYGSKKVAYEEKFNDQSVFANIQWTGVNEITYRTQPKPGSSNFEDLIELNGFFDFTMVTPRIFKGRYNIEFRAEADESSTNNQRATIQVYIDGIPRGVPIDLNSVITTSTGDKTNDRHRIGQVEFDSYSAHTIRVKTLAQGYFKFYQVGFVVAN